MEIKDGQGSVTSARQEKNGKGWGRGGGKAAAPEADGLRVSARGDRRCPRRQVRAGQRKQEVKEMTLQQPIQLGAQACNLRPRKERDQLGTLELARNKEEDLQGWAPGLWTGAESSLEGLL